MGFWHFPFIRAALVYLVYMALLGTLVYLFPGFSAWLARTLCVGISWEFAWEVYRAGLWHGGLGPQAAHIPPEYVGLAFAQVRRYVAERVQDVRPWLVYLST